MVPLRSILCNLLFFILLLSWSKPCDAFYLGAQTQWMLTEGIFSCGRSINYRYATSLIRCRRNVAPYLPDSPTPYFPDEDDVVERSLGIPIENGEPLKADESQQNDNQEIKSIWETIDELGRSFKPRAIKANAIASLVKKPSSTSASNGAGANLLYYAKKYMFLVQSSLFYVGYLLYRGYRGLFVILPEVFRVTFQKLESAIEDSPFTDDDESDVRNLSSIDQRNRVSPTQGIDSNKTVGWKTRMTISLLSSIITLSYVVGGALRVVSRMIKSQSFAAGVEEQEMNEKILYSKFSSRNESIAQDYS